MSKTTTTLLGIMIFYSILTFFFFPFVGYRFSGLDGITYGIVLGAIVSLVLWKQYGIHMVKTA